MRLHAVTATAVAALLLAPQAEADHHFVDSVNATCRANRPEALRVASELAIAMRRFLKHETRANVNRLGRAYLHEANLIGHMRKDLRKLHPSSADRGPFSTYITAVGKQLTEVRNNGRLYVNYRAGTVPTVKYRAGDAAISAAKAAGYADCGG
jgi:hypothetical protein